MKRFVKKLLLFALAATGGLASFGAGEGASQKWVKQYVEQYVSNAIAKSVATLIAEAKTSSSNGVNTIEVGEGDGRVTLTWEDATVYALMVTNATAAVAEYGITNGFVFVWDGDNSFMNGNGEIVTITSDTNKTCYTWHETDSVRTNGFDVFEDKFSVGGVMIQPSVAMGITNALATASEKRGVVDVLLSLLVPSAYADGNKKDPTYWGGNDAAPPYEGVIAYSSKDAETGDRIYKAEIVDLDKLRQLHENPLLGSFETKNTMMALIAALEAKITAGNIAKRLSEQDWTEKDAEVSDPQTKTSSSGKVTKTKDEIKIVAPGITVPRVDDNTIVYKDIGNGKKVLALKGLPEGTISQFRIPYLTWEGIFAWGDASVFTDETSIEFSNKTAVGKKYDVAQIKGWAKQLACKAHMKDMIADPEDDNASKHHVLCRYWDGGNWVVHYVPFGTGGIADESTLTAKAENSKTKGQIGIKGAYTEANRNKTLVSTGSGVEWKGTGVKFVGTDSSSNWGDDDGEPAQTISFASAQDSNVKVTVAGSKASATITIGVYYK